MGLKEQLRIISVIATCMSATVVGLWGTKAALNGADSHEQLTGLIGICLMIVTFDVAMRAISDDVK